ncbi:MAG: DNA translocase FtsK [Clostridia bacterium]|nr:DNA translocase FtsK [Clostridia bacterium]
MTAFLQADYTTDHKERNAKMKKSPVTIKTKNEPPKKRSKASAFFGFINKLMPYILAIVFVITLFSIAGIAGNMGIVWSRFLYGLFSNFASYFIVIFTLYHSLMWYHDYNTRILARRLICTGVTLICISVIQHIIMAMAGNEAVLTYNIKELFLLGEEKMGGGIFGGLLGTLLNNLMGSVASVIVVFMILIFMVLQMVNITPATITAAIMEKRQIRKQEKAKEKETGRKIKSKRISVFDEDDDDDIYIDEPKKKNNKKDIEEFFIYHGKEENDERKKKSSAKNRKSPSLYDQIPVNEFELTSPYDLNKNEKGEVDGVKISPETEYISPDKTYAEKKDIPTQDFKIDNTVVTDEFTVHHSSISDGFSDKKETKSEAYVPAESNNASADIFTDAGTYNYDDDIEDDLDNAIFSEESKVADADNDVLSQFLSDEAFAQIHGHSRDGKPIEEKPAEPVSAEPVAPPPPVKKVKKQYVFPPIDIFEKRAQTEHSPEKREEMERNARVIVDTLCSFNARTKIVDIQSGPTVTRYELVPEPGVRVRSIANLVDDIALNLAADGIRIECPIPGKSAVGIEVPNKITSTVYLRSLLEDKKFKEAKSMVTCAVGKSISGENVYIDVEKLPHLLVAGATGMGKSVCINALLVSLLYKASPDDLRLILIDPKRVEFSVFNGLPHLLVPVVCEAKKSIGTLQWAVAEMERRFEALEEAGVRNIGEFNDRVEKKKIDAEKFARIVIVIDELYDLKMQVPEIDEHIIRLTQKARAAGIHVIIGTQRPSVDVITGVIKANIPSRIAFRVPAQVDSRTILDEVGAEKLVSRGDMLLKPVGSLKPIRVQGAFITEDERTAVVEFIKEHSSENYDEEVISEIETNASKLAKMEKSADNESGGLDSDLDDLFYKALDIATDMGKVSASNLQIRLNIGFQRASRIISQMAEMGYVGEANGSKPREVLITKEQYMELRMRNED